LLKLDFGVLWTIVNILVFFLLLRIFLFKPVTQMMEKRQKAIADSLQDADDRKTEAYKLKSDYEDELKQASSQASAIIKEARDRADIEYGRILKEAKEEAAKVIADASKVIELERKKSMESAQAELAGLAMLAAAKVIGKNVDENTNKQYLGDFLKEVGAVK